MFKKTRKFIFSMLLLSLVALSLTACSYNEIEDDFTSYLENLTTNEEEKIEYTEDGRVIAPTKEPVEESSKIFCGIDETINSYNSAEDLTGDPESYNGIDGLEYTLNSVEVFSSLAETTIDISEMAHGTEELFENNAFILVELTAKYNSGNDDSIITGLTEYLVAYYEKNSGNDDFELNKETNPNIIEPMVIYCSEHLPVDDENYLKKYTMVTMNDGDEITFKLGIVVASEFIDTKNIYLEVSPWYRDGVDSKHYFFKLFDDDEV